MKLPFSTFLFRKQFNYEKAYNLQKLLVESKLKATGPTKPIVLLVEHSPVYTIGRRSHLYNEAEEKRLNNLGADFFRADRGGLITFHGPGQLVAYPIFSLDEQKYGVKTYVDMLEETIISLLDNQFNVKGERSPHTGVWVGNNKICAMGISVHRQKKVVSHGLALNCNTDMKWFSHIVACGIHGKGVTSLSIEKDMNVPLLDVVDPFVQSFESVFKWESQNKTVELDSNLDNLEILDIISKNIS